LHGVGEVSNAKATEPKSTGLLVAGLPPAEEQKGKRIVY